MTRLTDLIYLLYAYQQSDIDNLAAKLNERRRATWINELSALAAKHGCGQLAGVPRGQDAKELKRLAINDAQSIANTFNNDVRREIERLFKRNPRGNRSYFTSNLEKWAKKRDSWKTYQIGLASDSTTRQYAQSRFYANNPQVARGFVASGPPAVCKICLRLFAAGVVTFEFTQMNRFPAHVNCPHLWAVVAPIKTDCSKLWLG